MLINSAINPFRKELIQVLTQKKPNTFLKHFVRHIENITWASSLGLSSIASVIHLATATFAIVSCSTGPLFVAVVLTGTALAALAVVLAIATVILHQKYSATTQKTKMVESKKTEIAEIKVKINARNSSVNVSSDAESDVEESGYDSDESSDLTCSSDVTNSKKELKQKVSELQDTVDELRHTLEERDVAQDHQRFLSELTRRHKRITELEGNEVELTEKNSLLKAQLKEEKENKLRLEKEIEELSEKLIDKTELTEKLKEKKQALKEKLNAEIAAKSQMKKELHHFEELEKITENLMELNAHSTNLKSLLELQAQANELASQRDSGPDSPRRKQLVENYLKACVEIHTLKKELAKYKKESSNASLSRSSPVPRLKLEKQKEKQTDKCHSKKRKISPSPLKLPSVEKNQEPVRLSPQVAGVPGNSDLDWEIINVSPRNTGVEKA